MSKLNLEAAESSDLRVRHNVSLIDIALLEERNRIKRECQIEKLRFWRNVGSFVLPWVAGLVIIILMVFLYYWLVDESAGKSYLSDVIPLNGAQPEIPGREKIQTSYTVFTREFLLTGETLVTGKTYEPGNNQAVSQYCYLESIGGSASVGASYLAELADNEIIFYTTEKSLVDLVKTNCKFESYQ